MGGEAVVVGDLARAIVIVALVQAKMLRLRCRRCGARHDGGLKRLFQQLEVDHVGASDREAEGETAAVGQQ